MRDCKPKDEINVEKRIRIELLMELINEIRLSNNPDSEEFNYWEVFARWLECKMDKELQTKVKGGEN